MSSERHEVAIAILHQNGRFLMQLRDKIPGILYPGYWGLFGGHVEPGETPDRAVRRELLEEIGYAPDSLSHWTDDHDATVIRHVYQGFIAISLDQLVLNEGWDLDWLTAADIRQGQHYSTQAQETRPLGPPHQRLLLDFIQQQGQQRQ